MSKPKSRVSNLFAKQLSAKSVSRANEEGVESRGACAACQNTTPMIINWTIGNNHAAFSPTIAATTGRGSHSQFGAKLLAVRPGRRLHLIRPQAWIRSRTDPGRYVQCDKSGYPASDGHGIPSRWVGQRACLTHARLWRHRPTTAASPRSVSTRPTLLAAASGSAQASMRRYSSQEANQLDRQGCLPPRFPRLVRRQSLHAPRPSNFYKQAIGRIGWGMVTTTTSETKDRCPP